MARNTSISNAWPRLATVTVSLLVCRLSAVFAAEGGLSYEDILQGLLMRDSLVRSVTISYKSSLGSPSGILGAVPEKCLYVYRDDLVYMRTERFEGPRTYSMEAALNKQYRYASIDHGGRQAFLGGPIPPWASSTELKVFFRIGLQDVGEPLIGEWFRQKGGELAGTAKTDGHDVYIVSDKGKDNPQLPNGEGYVVWICPDYGFAPIRVYEFRHGALHHLYEFSGFSESGDMLWTPGKAHVWYFNVDRKIERFDPAHPTPGWLARVDVEIEEFAYNKQEYPDSFFDLKIPNGYTVFDSVVGAGYTVGGPISDPAIKAYVDNVKTVTRRGDLGTDAVATSTHPSRSDWNEKRKNAAPAVAQTTRSSPLPRKWGFVAALFGAFVLGFLFHRVRFFKK